MRTIFFYPYTDKPEKFLATKVTECTKKSIF
jgi:hypothetical protein